MAVQADYNSLAQQIYIAYFGRPADYTGLNNMTASLLAANVPVTGVAADDTTAFVNAYGTNTTIKGIIDNFGTSTESLSYFGTGTNEAFVNAIFLQILGRSPLLAGLSFWSSALSSGAMTRGEAALRIMEGALANTSTQGLVDAAGIANKTTAAASFTNGMTTTADVLGYQGATAAATARTWLSTVTDDAATLTTATSTVATTITAINTATSTVTTAGTTYTLTTAADVITGTANNDTINGTLPAIAASFDTTATLTAGDQINGGAGTDTLNISVSGSALPAVATATVTPNLAAVEKVLVSNIASEASGTDYVRVDLSLADTALTTVGTSASTTAGVLTDFANVGQNVAVVMAGKGNLTVGFVAAVTSGTADSLGLTANSVGSSTANATFDSDAGFETLNIVSATAANYLTLGGIASLTTVNVSGAKDISLNVAGSTNTAITTIDASTATGATNIDASGLLLADITVTGGAGTADTFTTDDAVANSSDLVAVTGFETLAFSNASVSLDAAITGVTGLDLTAAANTTLTLATNYTGATAVDVTGDQGNTINNTANVALTVTANVNDMAGATAIAGGSSTDALNLTADNVATIFGAGITGIETITILANADVPGDDAQITTDTANLAANKTLTVTAAALTSTSAALLFDGSAETTTIGNFAITGGAGNDSITGGSGNDTVDGGSGHDTITGGSGNDSLAGGAGNDTFVMAANLAATDIIDGGEGTDTLTVTTLTSAAVFGGVTNVEVIKITGATAASVATAIGSSATFDLTDTTAQTLTLATGYTGATTVNIKGDGATGDTITNTANVALTVNGYVADFASPNVVAGTTTGVETLNMTANNTAAATLATTTVNVDTINILANTTTASHDASLITVTQNVAANKTLVVNASALVDTAATFTFDGSAETTTVGHFSVTGGAGADTLTGGDGNDTIAGGSGNDVITLGAGMDSITAGDGTDTITAAGDLTFDDTIDGGAGTDTLTMTSNIGTAGELAHVTNVETLKLTGTGQAVTLSSSAIGFNALDTTTATAQTITLAGGFTGATTVTITADGGAHDSITNTANVALTVTGNVSDFTGTTVVGGTGADTLSLKANSGMANLSAVSAVETVTITANAANSATVTLGASTVIATDKSLTVNASALVTAGATFSYDGSAITGNGTQVVTGGANADIIIGGSGADTIDGGSGNDYISGGAGLDQITTGAGDDLVRMNANTNLLSFTTVSDFSAGDALAFVPDSTGAAIYGGTGATATSAKVTLSASAVLSDYINAAAAYNSGATTNTVVRWFNFGTNTYVVADSSDATAFDITLDKVIELTGTLNFTTSNLAVAGADTTLTLGSTTVATSTAVGVVPVAFSTNAVGDVAWTGTTGADTFSFGTTLTTADVVTGGGGADTLTFTDSGAATTDLNQVVFSSSSTIVLGDAVTSVVAVNNMLTGGASVLTVNGSGLTGTNTLTWDGALESTSMFSITGGAAADTITGGTGNDSIAGGDGADVIVGGAGSDVITITSDAAIDNVTLDAIAVAGSVAGADVITGFTTTSDNIVALDATYTWFNGASNGVVALVTAASLDAAHAISADFTVATISNNVITHTFSTYAAGTSTIAQLEGEIATALGAATNASFANTDNFLVAIDDGASTGIVRVVSAADGDAIGVAELSLLAVLVGVTDATTLAAGDFLFA